MSTPYIGSKISLISKSEIRYEGILYTVDPKESTIALAKVRSFGTESRPSETPMPPREEIYEYIIFKASDIKDLTVCETPQPAPQIYGGLPYDPAILKVSQSSVPHVSTAPFPPADGPSAAPQLSGLAGAAKMGGLTGSTPSRSETPLNRETSPKTEVASQTNARPPQNRAPGAGRQNIRRGGGGAQRGGGSSGQSQNQGQRRDQNVAGGHRQQTISGSSAGGGGGFHGGFGSFQQRDMHNQGAFRGRGGNGPRRVGGFYGPLNGAFFRGGGGFQSHQQHHRGGGGSSPFLYRGGGFTPMRGGFGGAGQHQQQHQQQQRRSSQSRGGQQHQQQRGANGQPLKFDNDYDFEKANEQFQETLSHLKDEFTAKAKIDDKEKDTKKTPLEEGEIRTAEESPVNETNNDAGERSDEDKGFYDKNKSFFDCISCEALERQQGKNTRVNWKKERELNTETFGQAALRNYQFRRGSGIRGGIGAGRGFRRGGYNSGGRYR